VGDYQKMAGDGPASAPLSRASAVRLVVVEDGSDGLDLEPTSDAGAQTLLITQTGGERPLDFARRAIRRVWALEREQRIVSVSLLLAPRFDDDATEGRICLVRALMAHSAAVARGASELLFSAGGDLHPDLQAQVLASVEALRQEPNGTSLPITVRFGPEGGSFAQHPWGPVDARSTPYKASV
jgi:hypothetical protein